MLADTDKENYSLLATNELRQGLLQTLWAQTNCSHVQQEKNVKGIKFRDFFCCGVRVYYCCHNRGRQSQLPGVRRKK